MKISCPACAAKYSIADEKVQERLAKIRCRKCGTTIVIDGKVHPPHVYAADASAADHPHVSGHSMGGDGSAAQEYSVDFGDNDQRTLPLTEIISAYNSGQVTAETYVWAEGMSDWKPLGEVPEIVKALHSAVSRPSHRPSAAAATPAASPWEAPRTSDASVARVAAKSGGRGGAGDLFGGFGSAGSEEDVTTSAPEGQMQQMAAATGARNESSVLFSLSALTAAAKSTASAPIATAPSLSAVSSPAAKKNHEDSGLIDLKALTASSPKSDDIAPIGVLGAPPLGMAAPLGYGAPLGGGLGAGVHADISYPEKKNKTGIVITAGILLAVVVIAGMFILRPAPPPPPAAPPVAAMTVPPAPTPTPDPVTAQPPATGTADPAASASAKAAAQKSAGRYRPRGGGGAKKSGGGAAPESGGDDSPAPKKAPVQRGGCGCAPSDLVCNMKCAAKGG